MPRRIAALAPLAVVLAACGGVGSVDIEHAWARPSPQMSDAGAVYLEITNGRDDRLVGAGVDVSVARRVEIHETSTNADGLMSMNEVGEVRLPAGTTVLFEPGGFHIMLMELSRPLVSGDTFEVTLEFAVAEPRTVSIEVREEAP